MFQFIHCYLRDNIKKKKNLFAFSSFSSFNAIAGPLLAVSCHARPLLQCCNFPDDIISPHENDETSELTVSLQVSTK